MNNDFGRFGDISIWIACYTVITTSIACCNVEEFQISSICTDISAEKKINFQFKNWFNKICDILKLTLGMVGSLLRASLHWLAHRQWHYSRCELAHQSGQLMAFLDTMWFLASLYQWIWRKMDRIWTWFERKICSRMRFLHTLYIYGINLCLVMHISGFTTNFDDSKIRNTYQQQQVQWLRLDSFHVVRAKYIRKYRLHLFRRNK